MPLAKSYLGAGVNIVGVGLEDLVLLQLLGAEQDSRGGAGQGRAVATCLCQGEGQSLLFSPTSSLGETEGAVLDSFSGERGRSSTTYSRPLPSLTGGSRG